MEVSPAHSSRDYPVQQAGGGSRAFMIRKVSLFFLFYLMCLVCIVCTKCSVSIVGPMCIGSLSVIVDRPT